MKRLHVLREIDNLENGLYEGYEAEVLSDLIARVLRLAAEMCDGDTSLLDTYSALVREHYPNRS